MTDPLMYGDTITVKVNPLLEQEIAQILENWVISMSEKEEIDILQEQFQAMREIIGKLAELGEVQPRTKP
ncbi:MAG: hypothetical protein VKL42_08880 [Snowella sp.]|nr:hypothetical protein [Snowella sp.]